MAAQSRCRKAQASAGTQLESDPQSGDATKEMAFRDALLELEEIEQLALIDRLPTHHAPPPPLKASTKRNHDLPIITSGFFNTIDPKPTKPQGTQGSGTFGGPHLRWCGVIPTAEHAVEVGQVGETRVERN